MDLEKFSFQAFMDLEKISIQAFMDLETFSIQAFHGLGKIFISSVSWTYQQDVGQESLYVAVHGLGHPRALHPHSMVGFSELILKLQIKSTSITLLGGGLASFLTMDKLVNKSGLSFWNLSSFYVCV